MCVNAPLRVETIDATKIDLSAWTLLSDTASTLSPQSCSTRSRSASEITVASRADFLETRVSPIDLDDMSTLESETLSATHLMHAQDTVGGLPDIADLYSALVVPYAVGPHTPYVPPGVSKTITLAGIIFLFALAMPHTSQPKNALIHVIARMVRHNALPGHSGSPIFQSMSKNLLFRGM